MTSITSTVPLSAEAAAYLARINAPGVTALAVHWTSEVKPAAKHAGVTLTKDVTALAMAGVEYRNLTVNNDRVTGDLPWGEWAVYPHIIHHKGVFYARLYTVDGSLRTTYRVNGTVVDKATFDSYRTAGARKTKRPHGGTICVKVNSITVLS